MDVLDVAIRLEQEGAKFYEELTKNAPTQGFATIFTMLAEDERKHERYFKALKEKHKPITASTMIIDEARKIFQEFDPTEFPEERDQIPAYERAIEIEQKSIDLYREQVSISTDESEKHLLNIIIEEEERHKRVLTELLGLVVRPHRWVEDAEFGIREEY